MILPFKWNLGSLPLSLKVLITAFVLSVAVGYSISLLQVFERAGIKVEQTVRHYRGAEGAEGEVFIPQSYTTLLSTTHVHTFSQPLLLGLLGFLFALTAASERSKIGWILASFLGSLASNAGPWAIRYLWSGAVYLLYAGGAAMFLSFAAMSVTILHETWWRGGADV